MVRIAGYFAGSAIAVAMMLVVLGIPELREVEEPPPAIVNIPLPEPEEPEIIATQPVEPVEAVTSSLVVQPELPAEPVLIRAGTLPTQWHAFWSPFASRIAANGFVSRLETVTGFDYRVIKVENGEFEVAFAYTSDAERDAILTSIATATGLELPGQ